MWRHWHTSKMYFLLALATTIVAATRSQDAETLGNASEVQRTFNWGYRDGNNNFNCPAIYGRYPHPKSCEYFFECRFGLPTLMHCNRGYLYDERREQCRESRRVHCKITGKGGDDEPSVKEDEIFRCPYIWGTFAHPSDCSKYYICIYKMPTLHQCPNSELYEDRSRKCLPRNRVNCGHRIDKNKPKVNFRCPKSCGIFDHPNNCNTFIVCVDNVPSAFVCPQGQLFDKSSKKCLSKELVTCNKGVNPDDSKKPTGSGLVTSPGDLRDRTTSRLELTTAVPRFTGGPNSYFCPFPDGRYADSDDCSRYFDCRSGVPRVRQCPANHLYDERQEECRNKHEVRCGNRPVGIGDDVEGGKRDNVWCPYDWGTFTHPRDCSKFILCIYNVPTVYSCKKQELFDETTRRCLPSHSVNCGNRINPDDLFRPGDRTTQTYTRPTVTTRPLPVTTRMTLPPETPTPTQPPRTAFPAKTTFTPYKTERPTTFTTYKTERPTTFTPYKTERPTTFTASKTEKPTTFTPYKTERPTTFTPYKTERPVKKPNTPPPTNCKEDDIDCIIDETGDPKGWFDCPGMFGHYPHAASRQLFIHCDRWRPFIKSCADGTVFHPQLLVCVWK